MTEPSCGRCRALDLVVAELKAEIAHLKKGGWNVAVKADDIVDSLKDEIERLKEELQDFKDCYDPIKSGLRRDEVHCACAYELHRDNQKLREENERLQKFIDNWSMNKHDWQKENIQLRDALKKYGSHNLTKTGALCRGEGFCDCGLDQALSEKAESSEKDKCVCGLTLAQCIAADTGNGLDCCEFCCHVDLGSSEERK